VTDSPQFRPWVSPPPAEGERRAVMGYGAQYAVAAELVYDRLRSGTLEWIRLADPLAGRLDDLQIATPGRLDAYQVKWSEYDGTLTFADLLERPAKSKGERGPSLIDQLVDGWMRLRELHSPRFVHVHLVSNDIASPNRTASIPRPPSLRPAHLQAFLRHGWPTSAVAANAVPDECQPALEAIRQHCGLCSDDFRSFSRACYFDLGFKRHHLSDSSEARQRARDVDELARFFFQIVGDPERHTVELSANRLLGQLGWGHRFRQNFAHEFPVDEAIYRPIQETVADLESALSTIRWGYVAVVGTPGSGKSTLLTQVLRYRRGIRLIRYYAFIPDDPRQGRGESSRFLEDLVHALRRLGVYGPGIAQPRSREDFQNELASQLTQLGERWKTDGTLTVIAIDGLDHIEREQLTVERSLLKDLPTPASLPEGVLFVLGTQRADLHDLSPRIRVHLDEPTRTIIMRPLDRAAVYAVVDAALPSLELVDEDKSRIHTLSEGHPLALRYIIERLRQASNRLAAENVLASLRQYGGHIEEDYRIYWGEVASDDDLADILGLICRLRQPFDPQRLAVWRGERVARKLLSRTRHYFRDTGDGSIAFFHNSFRVFLETETARNLLGKYEPDKSRSLHRMLADLSAASPTEDAFSWEEIYHRFESNDFHQVLDLGTQERLRAQYFNGRSYDDIRDDLRLVLSAARELDNGVAVVRSLLIATELGDREDKSAIIARFEVALELDGAETAERLILRGHELLAPAHDALQACQTLLQAGHYGPANRIFDAAEPLSPLAGTAYIEPFRGSNLNDIENWARVAHRFRPLSRILNAISNLRSEEAQGSGLNHTEWVRDHILNIVIEAVVHTGDHTQLAELRSALEQSAGQHRLALAFDLAECWHATGSGAILPDQRVKDALRRLTAAAETDALGQTTIEVAELVFRMGQDRDTALRLIDRMAQLSPYNPLDYGSHAAINAFSPRLRRCRLLSALGKPIAPDDAVPEAKQDYDVGTVLFERMIVRIANVWGRAWAGEPLTSGQIVRELFPALVVFDRPWTETQHWHSWYSFRTGAADYFLWVIACAAAHSIDCVRAIGQFFRSRWEQDRSLERWPVAWRRAVALQLFSPTDDIADLVRDLDKLEERTGRSGDPQERIADILAHAKAWIIAREPVRARAVLPNIHRTSFGIWHRKDDQLTVWGRWLARAVFLEPELAGKRIRSYAGAVALCHSERRGGARSAPARLLLRTAVTWRPSIAATLRNWLLDNAGADYDTTIEGLLLGALDADPCQIELISIILRYILIPFQHSCNKSLANLYVARLYKFRSADDTKIAIKELVSALARYAFPSIRGDWVAAVLDGVRRAGDDGSWLPRAPAAEPENIDELDRPIFTLSTGETVDEKALLDRISTPASLVNTMTEVISGDIPWQTAVGRLDQPFRPIEAAAIAQMLCGSPATPFVLTEIADRLLREGHREQAVCVYRAAIERSNSYGWHRFYDGGSKLEPFLQLLRSDNARYHIEAFSAFVSDLIEDQASFAWMLRDLDTYLPILFAVDPPIAALFEEIEHHYLQLHEFGTGTDLPPADLAGAESSIPEMLIRLLFSELERPIQELNAYAHRAVCEIIIASADNDQAVAAILSEWLEDSDDLQLRALALLRDTAQGRPDFCMKFAKCLERLYVSNSIAIRRLAGELARALGVGPRGGKPRGLRLSPIYTLELPALAYAETRTGILHAEAGEPLAEIPDPLEMVASCREGLDAIAVASRIPLQNLVARMLQLMREVAPVESWNRQAEEHLLEWLRGIRLETAYRRPRADACLRAFARICAELWDARWIGQSVLASVRHLIDRRDTVFSLREPASRPPELPVPFGIELKASKQDDWLEGAGLAATKGIAWLNDGRYMLAEQSQFVRLEWSVPTERRYSALVHPDWPVSDQHERHPRLFPWRPEWIPAGYPTLPRAADVPTTVISGSVLGLDVLPTGWLALNPVIAEACGWRPSSRHLFGWWNGDGELMVESVWWKDGSLSRHPPRFNDVCSEGFLVLASASALTAIVEACGYVERVDVVNRSWKPSGRSDDQSEFTTAINRSPV